MGQGNRSSNLTSRLRDGGLPWLMLLLFLPAAASFAHADQTEVRDYSVVVDGKPAGYNQLIITEKADGTTVVTNRANASVKFFLTFTFSYQGTELWQKYRLLRVDGQGKENRTIYNVSAVRDEAKRMMLLTVNKKQQLIPENVWPSTFWKLPEIKARAQAVTVLKSSSGTVINAQLQFLAAENRPVAGQNQTCYHFRIVGGKKPIDLWYDAHHRLVCQEFTEMGHRTVVELTNLRRTNPQPANAPQPRQQR